MKTPIYIVTIVGARPQFIKAAILSKAIKKHNTDKSKRKIKEVLVHTGQHYDFDMSQVFFEQMEIPEPKYHLNVGSGQHGEQTAAMLNRLEKVLLKERPDLVIVYGDTNSTLAGAIAAAKLNIPIAHVEAGLRSFNRNMPEEVNRILTDRISSLLFCPTETSVLNLKKEGITNGVYQVGDVMLDAFLNHKKLALKASDALKQNRLKARSYCLATIHRQENTDNKKRLRSIFAAFSVLADRSCPFIVPLHPRTRKALLQIKTLGQTNENVRMISPLNYLDMIALESNAMIILTDSGGVQREAYFAHIPCLTVRNETEWTETVESGWNVLAGARTDSIIRAFHHLTGKALPPQPKFYGDGRSAERIIEVLLSLAPWREH